MDSQLSVASSAVESQVSEEWSSEEEESYDDYYGEPLLSCESLLTRLVTSRVLTAC